MTRRRAGLEAGSGPLAFTAMVMSFAMRANCFAMRFQRANMVCLRTSKMRPMAAMVHQANGRCQPRAARAAARRLKLTGCARWRASGELGLQHAHASQLRRQAPLDL